MGRSRCRSRDRRGPGVGAGLRRTRRNSYRRRGRSRGRTRDTLIYFKYFDFRRECVAQMRSNTIARTFYGKG